MPIVIIEGPAKSGKSTIAAALRNAQISTGKGALLVDENSDGETAPLLEKIIVGVNLPEEPGENWAKTIPFKPDSMVILVGNSKSKLEVFEGVLPGFAEVFGPVWTIKTGE